MSKSNDVKTKEILQELIQQLYKELIVAHHTIGKLEGHKEAAMVQDRRINILKGQLSDCHEVIRNLEVKDEINTKP